MTKWIDRRHHYSYAEARRLAAHERAEVIRLIGGMIKTRVAGWLRGHAGPSGPTDFSAAGTLNPRRKTPGRRAG